MALVTVAEFQKYTNVFLDDAGLQETYILSAQDVVSDYLGYDPSERLLNPSTGELEETVAAPEIKRLPEIIRLTAMRIAALLQSEEGSNIGVNSKSFGDGGTRVFVSFVNFDKYLLPISKYRLIRI